MVPRVPSLRIQLRVRQLRIGRYGARAQGQAHLPAHPPVSCRHCDDPLCVKSCIAGALSKVDGIIRVDRERCVGCLTCVLVCPYGALAPAGDGIMQKCELCLENACDEPACVAGCPNRAIVYEERGERA